MAELTGQAVEPRRLSARLGICLLNLWHPGLGLVRLAHYRVGLVLMSLSMAAAFSALGYYAFEPQLDFTRFLVLAALVLGAELVLCGTGIVLSWQRSRDVVPRAGWMWRWYGLLSLGLAFTLLWQLTPDLQSYYRGFHAVSQSMVPTLQPGDRLIADMRLRTPLERGDLAVIKVRDEDYVMRLAALPGDTVAMRRGVVVINGRPVPQRVVGRSESAEGISGRLLSEQFPRERSPHVVFDRGPSLQDDLPVVELGAGEYFFLGDSRDNSVDSRFDETMGGPGIVGRSRIAGKVLFGWWRSGAGFRETPL